MPSDFNTLSGGSFRVDISHGLSIEWSIYLLCNKLKVYRHYLEIMANKRKKRPRKKEDDKTRALEFKEDEERYAKITKTLGNKRFQVICDDKKECLAILPGRFRRRHRVVVNDFVLISIRPFGQDRVDIIHRYTAEEARSLVSWNEIPVWMGASDNIDENDDADVVFDDLIEEDICIDDI